MQEGDVSTCGRCTNGGLCASDVMNVSLDGAERDGEFEDFFVEIPIVLPANTSL